MPHDYRAKRDQDKRAESQRRARPAQPKAYEGCCKPYPLATWRRGVLVSVILTHRGKHCAGSPGADALDAYRR